MHPHHIICMPGAFWSVDLDIYINFNESLPESQLARCNNVI